MDNKVIEYSIIGAYLVFIVAKGIKQSGKIKDKEDFLIAGRNTGWFMLFCTVSATIVGGGYSIGAIGKTFENGLLWVIVSIGGYMQLVFSGKYIAPIFRKHNLYTIAAYFRKRFDHRSGFIAFLLSMLFSVGVLGAQLIAFGEIINHMIPEIPYNIAVVIGASVVILYSTIGGLFAVIHTDMYQFIILSIGFFITAVLCIPEILSSGAPPIPSDFLSINTDQSMIFLITTFIAFLLGETFAPGYITRFGAAKDIKTAKKGIIRSGIFLTIVFPIFIFIISLYARMYLPGIDPQQALPRVIDNLHNSIMGGIIVAALMSAVMSSADSILNSLTAIITKDFLEEYFHNNRIVKEKGLRIARLTSLILGISGIIMALAIPDIIDMLLLTYSLWAPGIIIPVLVGVFSKKPSETQNTNIFLTMIIAMGITVIFMAADINVYGKSLNDIIQPLVVGVTASVITYMSLRVFRKERLAA